MNRPESLSLADYRYDLPEDRIAPFPLEQRDSSRLLVCDSRSGAISDRRFTDLPSILPPGALLIANDTRVVRARIIFTRETGGRVEIFLLEPLAPSRDPGRALAATGETRWLCLVGGARKMRKEGKVRLSLEQQGDEGSVVLLQWTPPEMTFGEVLERAGRIPLPPYIRRDAMEDDNVTYQTIYAANEGAVAAPTAGLHFTPEVMRNLADRGIEQIHVTLHVGAGTFRPVQTENPLEHRMHDEMFAISHEALDSLIGHARRREQPDGPPIVAVGTTTLRTIESLYWAGVRIMAGEITAADEELLVEQWDPYRLAERESALPSLADALQHVLDWGEGRAITGRTRIMIVPGYDFKCCDALVTNFHQPESTLILLVAAFLGGELWREVYRHALDNGYRFLSYGDSSVLVRGRV